MSDDNTPEQSPELLQLAAELDAEVARIAEALSAHQIILTERPAQAMLIVTLTAMMVAGMSFIQVMEFAAATWDGIKPQVEAAIAAAALSAMPVSATVHG